MMMQGLHNPTLIGRGDLAGTLLQSEARRKKEAVSGRPRRKFMGGQLTTFYLNECCAQIYTGRYRTKCQLSHVIMNVCTNVVKRGSINFQPSTIILLF